MALANLGFIVVEVGNRGGNPHRSKWYHTYGYGNLRDYGLADKKAAVEQLAARYPWIDIDRVGITGHSGGGFMSTAAMLVYPDFFKVAVSESGNHENNIYNAPWSEKHHGVKEVTDKDGKVTFEYSIDKNSEIAKNLKGHLLISTGDIDNNVHPGNTLRLADALHQGQQAVRFRDPARTAARLRTRSGVLLVDPRRLFLQVPAGRFRPERRHVGTQSRQAAGRRTSDSARGSRRSDGSRWARRQRRRVSPHLGLAAFTLLLAGFPIGFRPAFAGDFSLARPAFRTEQRAALY